MRHFLFVVVLAVAVLGALSQVTYPPTLNPGADGWHSCGDAYGGKQKCHDFGDWNASGKEYLVMMKTPDNKKLQLQRIASGKTAYCNVDFFGGQPADSSAGHDCFFTEVDGEYIKNPVSAKGWSDKVHVRDEIVTLPPGLWAIKFQTKGDVHNYVVGLSGANYWVQHFCRDAIVGMTYGTNMQHVKDLWSPVSGPNEMDGLCIVSKEPVIAAEDMDFFDEFARKGERNVIPFLPVMQNGLIIRMGNPRTHKWTYAQIHEYKQGEPVLCSQQTFRMVGDKYYIGEPGGEVCQFFNPPPNYMPSFYNNFAKWVLQRGVDGRPGETFTISYTAEVSSTRGTDLSEEWGMAVTASVEASVEIQGAGGVTVGLSTEQSKTISQSVSSEVSRGTSITHQITCTVQEGDEYVGMWSWEITGDEASASQTLPDSDYAIMSTQTGCTGSSHPPCCPPGWKSSRTDIDCRTDPSFVVEHHCERKLK